MKPKIVTASFYVCAAGACFYLFGMAEKHWLYQGYVLRVGSWLPGLIVPLMFLVGSLLAFFKPRFGYAMGLAAGLLGLSYMAQGEFARYQVVNSWAALNLPDGGENDAFIRYATLTILATAVLLVSTSCSVIRLFPTEWTLRKLPVRDRIWPAFAISFGIVAAWFVSAVVPYRAPIIERGGQAQVSVSHAERHGLRFHETKVSVFRDGRFYILHNDRRLFHYRFDCVQSTGYLPDEPSLLRFRQLAESPGIGALRSSQNASYQVWNSDRWCINTQSMQAQAMQCVSTSEIPQKVVAWFDEVRKLPTEEVKHFTKKDVCLGFCYNLDQ